ncbi:MAG: hypothetical protein A2817_01450 [Candidatus Yanofskybacteria bacterium RIFCSPHIGHO2_01_FULL_39_8b]|uniref:Uncharacterized protein n=1 Tax=Candidatus Yanofskybacteria bacterium RIFCSPHIGHO2_01_FULL_39_8b TaxID=1802659 RepID=A0A1F8EA21_9BACT|nr:MAG: hypothetical protein A2817_01450 [Candidatus Yanofskybacteria bacterium RIFCSPHIGHO2_01_FULL_39_8b]
MHIIKEPITRLELKKIADETFGYVVKGAVDIEQEKIGLGGELHIDIAVELHKRFQSKNNNLWGINLYPDKTGEEFIEFDSMVNIKPNLGNRTRSIDSQEIRDKIKEIVNKFILE